MPLTSPAKSALCLKARSCAKFSAKRTLSLFSLSAGGGWEGRSVLAKTCLGGVFSCLLAAFSAIRENVNLRVSVRSRGAGKIDVDCIQTGLWDVLANHAG